MAIMTDTDRSSGDIKQSVVQWLRVADRPTALADYQRPYVWPESHVTAFTETILDALFPSQTDGTGMREMAGRALDIGVVIVETSEGRESVVDGQQRLLTFSLLIAELCRDKIFGSGSDDWSPSSRLRQLLRPRNLQSVLHARQAGRIIRNLISRRPGLQKLNSDEKLERLGRVTFSVVPFGRASDGNTDPAVTKFFEPLNTTAKPLNGGQILKAHHMGRILKDKPDLTWACQSRYEQWFRRCAGEDFELRPFDPVCFNLGRSLSIERFIDSPGEDVRYRLGCGFVQAVQAMLLGQENWWREIARQGKERQLPFERLEGRAVSATSVDVRWRATDPLDFPEAEGFFRMVARLGRVYDAYCRELLTLPDFDGWAIKKDFSDRPLPADDDPDRRPARLVLCAARRLAVFGNVLKAWSAQNDRLQSETALRAFCRWEGDKPAAIREHFLWARSWLGIDDEGRNFHVTFGVISVAPIAVALLWSDRYPDAESDDDIVRLLTLQLLFANVQAQIHSVLRALAVPEAVAAAHFSEDSQGALWRFMKTARFEGTEWPRKLESMLERMPGGREEEPSDLKLFPKQEKALAELRNILSQYLSF